MDVTHSQTHTEWVTATLHCDICVAVKRPNLPCFLPLRVSVTHMWWWIFCSWPPASQLSPCPTSPIWPAVCLIWAFHYCVCVLSSNLMRTKSSPIAAKQKIVHFPNAAAHGCSDSFVFHSSLSISPTVKRALTTGLFIQSKKKKTTFTRFCRQRHPIEISRSERGGFCKFLQGKDKSSTEVTHLLRDLHIGHAVCAFRSLVFMLSSWWADGKWMDICRLVSAAFAGKKKKKCRAAGMHVCACNLWLLGRRV